MGSAACSPAIVGIDFDPVRAFADLFTHDARQSIHTVGFFCSLGHVPFGCITLRTISAGRDNCARSYKHSWSGNNSLLHSLFQSNIRVAGALRAQVANRCEPGHERAAQMIGRTRHAQAQRFARDLIVPNGLAVRMKQDVGMRVNQSGH